MFPVRHTAAPAPPPRLCPEHLPRAAVAGPAPRQALIIGSRWPPA